MGVSLSVQSIININLIIANQAATGIFLYFVLPSYPWPSSGSFLSKGTQFMIELVQRSSLILAIWPAHLHFNVFILHMISVTLVCVLIHSLRFLSLLVIPTCISPYFSLKFEAFDVAYYLTSMFHSLMSLQSGHIGRKLSFLAHRHFTPKD